LGELHTTCSPQFPGLWNQCGPWPTLEFNGTELVSSKCLPVAKTNNLTARSIRALFKGKVRLPLMEVRKGLQSSSIRWRGSLESDAGASLTDYEWRSSMA
jgi:hypothetical protein